jgi:hypothetical protein
MITLCSTVLAASLAELLNEPAHQTDNRGSGLLLREWPPSSLIITAIQRLANKRWRILGRDGWPVATDVCPLFRMAKRGGPDGARSDPLRITQTSVCGQLSGKLFGFGVVVDGALAPESALLQIALAKARSLNSSHFAPRAIALSMRWRIRLAICPSPELR